MVDVYFPFILEKGAYVPYFFSLEPNPVSCSRLHILRYIKAWLNVFALNRGIMGMFR